MISEELIALANNSPWLDCQSYWLNTSPQLSKEWHIFHHGRITASRFSACAGHNSFCTPNEIIEHVTSTVIENKVLTEHGIVTNII